MAHPADEAVARLVRTLESVGIRNYAFTGAIALGVWTEPRETHDLDLCGELPPEALLPLLAQLDGMRFGPSEVPDIVRFRVGDWDVDLFVAKGEADRECLERAPTTTIGGVSVRVVTPEDLVVHKMRKLRSDRRRILQDVADLRALFARRPLDWSYIHERVAPGDASILQAIRDLPDDALLERLRAGGGAP